MRDLEPSASAEVKPEAVDMVTELKDDAVRGKYTVRIVPLSPSPPFSLCRSYSDLHMHASTRRARH